MTKQDPGVMTEDFPGQRPFDYTTEEEIRLNPLLNIERRHQQRIRNQERRTDEVIDDSFLSFLSGLTGTFGALHSQAEGILRSDFALDFFNDLSRSGIIPPVRNRTENVPDNERDIYNEERAAEFSEYYNSLNNALRERQSSVLKEKYGIASDERRFEQQDREEEHAKRIANGENPLVSSLRLIGKEVLDESRRFGNEPSFITDTVAAATGSLLATAPLAAAGGATSAKIAEGTIGALRGSTTALRRGREAFRLPAIDPVARTSATISSGAATGASRTAGRFSTATPGAAAAIGAVEASGTFSEAIAEASSIPEEKIRETDEYKQAREEGLSDNEAIDRTIASIAQIAATRQLPVATALGILSAGFTRAPVRHFRGKV